MLLGWLGDVITDRHDTGITALLGDLRMVTGFCCSIDGARYETIWWKKHALQKMMRFW
jgi:hypothetical protein